MLTTDEVKAVKGAELINVGGSSGRLNRITLQWVYEGKA